MEGEASPAKKVNYIPINQQYHLPVTKTALVHKVHSLLGGSRYKWAKLTRKQLYGIVRECLGRYNSVKYDRHVEC